MGSKIWIINILLFCMVLFCLARAYDVWIGQDITPLMTPDDGQEKSRHEDAQASVKMTKNIHASEFYDAIVRKNLFFPDRTGIDEAVNIQANGVVVRGMENTATEILLYGVMILGEERKALISNPFPEKNEAMIVWVKQGDHLGSGPGESGMIIKEIQNEKIVVSISEKDVEYHVFEAKDELIRNGASATERKAMHQNNENNHSGFGSEPGGDHPEMPFEISPDGTYKIFETPFGKIKRRIN